MNIAIIGGGASDTSILQTLTESLSIRILGIVIDQRDEEAIELAESLEIPIEYNLYNLLERIDIDLIVDLSDSEDIRNKIAQFKPARAEVVDRSDVQLICRLLESESRVTQDLVDRLTREHWSIYEIGISLSSARDLSEVSRTIIEHATKLTNTPAGSLAVFNEKSGEMVFATSVGFSNKMATQKSWKLRTGGLTNYILNQKDPVIISNIDDYPEFKNPQLVSEGIRALIACPLFLNNKVVGIIYVDDFKVREFRRNDISTLCLLSTYAAIAIEKAKLLEETKLLAITDDLTELYNHRYLIQQLSTEIIRAERYNDPLSFIIIDIDNFKHYNDTQGHVKGNEVLRQLAQILQHESRAYDIVARYGGEEFTVICPKTDKRSAFELAERLRKKVEEHVFPDAHTQPMGRVTISAGVATYPEDSNNPLGLIDKADLALYLAKRNGKNRVFAHQQSKDSGFKIG